MKRKHTHNEAANICNRHGYKGRGIGAGIILDSRTDLYIFTSAIVIGEIYRDEFLDPHFKLFCCIIERFEILSLLMTWKCYRFLYGPPKCPFQSCRNPTREKVLDSTLRLTPITTYKRLVINIASIVSEW